MLKIYILVCLVSFNIGSILGQADSSMVKVLLDKAYSLEKVNLDSSLQVYRDATKLAIKAKYWIGAGRATSYSGIVHSDYGNNDSAIFYHKKSIPLYKRANYARGVGSSLINIGNVYQFMGAYQPAMDYYLKGIEVYERTKDTANLIISYANMASLFTDFRMYGKSIKYQSKALAYSKVTNDSLNIAYTSNDLGLSYLLTDSLSKAYHNFKSAQSIGNAMDDPDLNFYTYKNLHEYFFKKKHIDSAYYYMLLGDKNASLTKKPYLQAYAKDALAKLHLQKGNLDSGRAYATRALDLANSIDAKEHLMNAYLSLSNVEALNGNYRAAYSALDNYIKYKDSVLGKEQQEYITRLENLYQLNEKNNEILIQQLALEQSERELQRSRSRNLLFSLLALLVTGIAFLFWYRARQKKKLSEQTIKALEQEKELNAITSLIKGEDMERERIARDLHDSLNGSLAAIKLHLASVPKQTLDAKEASTLNLTMEMIDQTCEKVRNISHNLAPPALIHSGIIEALKSYSASLTQSTSIQIDFQHFGEKLQLDKKAETTLFHIAQELIQNSLKHSCADKILVQLYVEDTTCHLTVEDNGQGFDVSNIDRGMGLHNVESRCTFLNGDLDIRSDEKGTCVTVIINNNKIPLL